MKYEKLQCPYCDLQCGSNIIRKHIKLKHPENLSEYNESNVSKYSCNISIVCPFCDKVAKNNLGASAHQRRCPQNPNSKEINDKFKCVIQNHPISNQYIKAKKLGLPKPIISEETRKKISINASKQMTETYKNPENRKLQSHRMKLAVEKYPESYSINNIVCRWKQEVYNNVMFKSSWEIKTAQWLDSLGVKWLYEHKWYNYEFNGEERKYFPDFYLPEYDLYIEVKGYQSDRDVAKWNAMPKTILLLDSKYINELSGFSVFEDIIDLMKW